jgi:hypothetical protein
MAAVLDAARARAATVSNVFKLQVAPKAIDASRQHDASELRPSPTSAANGGFKRRF